MWRAPAHGESPALMAHSTAKDAPPKPPGPVAQKSTGKDGPLKGREPKLVQTQRRGCGPGKVVRNPGGKCGGPPFL